MWFGGCQSLVAILIVKGRSKRELMMWMTSRPLGTARLPFCDGVVRWVVCVAEMDAFYSRVDKSLLANRLL